MPELLQHQSARLIYANGHPDMFTTCQVYEPTDDEHRKKGFLLLLLRDLTSRDGEFVSSLSSAVIRDYWRPNTPAGIDGLERGLHRCNEMLAGESSHHLSGAIALVYDNELHVSTIGDGQAWLWRDAKTISIQESGGKDTVFSTLLSGEIRHGDAVVLASSADTSPNFPRAIEFAFQHTPFTEACRALARALVENSPSRDEALVCLFSRDPTDSLTISLDKSLLTQEEKFDLIRQRATTLLKRVVPKQATRLIEFQPSASTPKTTSLPEDVTIDTSAVTLVKTDDSLSNPQFAVKSYKKSAAADTSFDTPPTAVSDVEKTTYLNLLVKRARTIKPRTLYLLGGILAVIIIVIAIFNRAAGPPTNRLDEQQLNALVTQAQQLERDADTARAQNDTQLAVSKLLEIQDLLKPIEESRRNEAAKALGRRTETALNELTATRVLTDGRVVKLGETARKIVRLGQQLAILGDGSFLQLASTDSLTPVAFTGQGIVDATATADGSRLIVLAESPAGGEVWHVDPIQLSSVKIARADGKPWPVSRLIVAFDANIYLVGDAIVKAVATSTAYRVVPFTTVTNSRGISSIIAGDTTLIAMEDNRLVRFATATPKTDIALHGVPSHFWPESLGNLKRIPSDGQFALSFAADKRIVIVSNDGGYKRQYRLVSDKQLTDCAMTATFVGCITDDGYLVTYPIP